MPLRGFPRVECAQGKPWPGGRGNTCAPTAINNIAEGEHALDTLVRWQRIGVGVTLVNERNGVPNGWQRSTHSSSTHLHLQFHIHLHLYLQLTTHVGIPAVRQQRMQMRMVESVWQKGSRAAGHGLGNDRMY